MYTVYTRLKVAKSNQLLGLIKRYFVYKDIQSVKLLYTALVRPHLEHGNAVWHPMYKKDIDLLEKFREELLVWFQV